MICLRQRPLLVLLLLLAAVIPGPAAAATGFPEITAEERTLTSVPSHPNAPAVVLFKKGEFSMIGTSGNRYASGFSVQVRRKILTEEGKRFGEVSVFHSKWAKLQNLKGRTVTPDGKVVPLPKDAVFRRKTSQSERTFVTSIAFPAVQVGAILDYSYEIRVDSIFFLEPWYFQDEVPTLYSEMIFAIPLGLDAKTLARDPMNTRIEREVTRNHEGTVVKTWGKNLPAVPEEPSSVPFADLASSFMLVPTRYQSPYGGKPVDLFKDWPSTCDLFAEGYQKTRKKGKAAEAMAKSLAAKAGGGPGEQARAVHRFVRDQIETDLQPGVGVADNASVDAMLTAKHGSPIEKALLLQTMLAALGLDARLVWVAERWDGALDFAIANPQWFDRALVAAQIDGQRVFLDPVDRSLGFGRLSPGLEGMQALLYDPKTPEVITLPSSRFDENLRQAKVDLEVDAEGRLAGRGTLSLTGLHAWSQLDSQEDPTKVTDYWKKWLDDAWKGYEVKDVEVRQSVDDQRVDVTWSLAQRDEDVLGDEVSLVPSRPLGPVHQPFILEPARRVSPVLLAFPDRDELELSLRWPEGWKPEALPLAMNHQGPVGGATVKLDVNQEARTLTYKRLLDLKERQLAGAGLYKALQTLYAEVERHDAQALVLVHQ